MVLLSEDIINIIFNYLPLKYCQKIFRHREIETFLKNIIRDKPRFWFDYEQLRNDFLLKKNFRLIPILAECDMTDIRKYHVSLYHCQFIQKLELFNFFTYFYDFNYDLNQFHYLKYLLSTDLAEKRNILLKSAQQASVAAIVAQPTADINEFLPLFSYKVIKNYLEIKN